MAEDTIKSQKEKFDMQMFQIKALCATFFAKTEDKVDSNQKEVDRVLEQMETIRYSLKDPRRELDGLLFSLRARIDTQE